MPISRGFCGTRATAEPVMTNSSEASVSAARVGSIAAPLMMRSRLIDTATNSSPVSAAATPVSAVKNDCQSGGL